MALSGGRLLVAHSRLGLIAFDRKGRVSGRVALAAGDHPGPKAQAFGGPYTMDIETVRGMAYVSDGSFGRLTLLPLGSI